MSTPNKKTAAIPTKMTTVTPIMVATVSAGTSSDNTDTDTLGSTDASMKSEIEIFENQIH